MRKIESRTQNIMQNFAPPNRRLLLNDLDCFEPHSGVEVIQIEISPAKNALTTIAAVLGSPSAKQALVPIETTSTRDTGAAIVHVGTSLVSVCLRRLSEQGVEAGNKLNSLESKSQLVGFVTQFSQVYRVSKISTAL